MKKARKCALALTAAALLWIGAAQSQTLVVGTGAKGGTFYDYGPGIVGLMREQAGGTIEIRETGGSNENAKLLQDGTLQLGLVNMGPAFEAWNASEPWVGGQRMTKLRALFPMYETPFYGAALTTSGIASVRALDGRKVGLGPARGPAENIFRALFEVIALKPQIVSGSPSEMAAMVVDGRLDAFAYGAGLPLPAFQEIEAKAPMTVFGLTDAEIAALRGRFPYMAPYTIPAGIYRGQDKPIGTVALWNFVLAGADLPDATAYALVKAVMDQPERVAKVHPSASATVARNAAADTFLPFHPGALRYYREHGIALTAPAP